MTSAVQLWDGKWYRCGEAYIHLCCDCGLAHSVTFKMDKGVLYYQWNRDEPATELERRKSVYPCKPGRKPARKGKRA